MFHETQRVYFWHRLVYFVADFHAADGGVTAVNPQPANKMLLPFTLHFDNDVVAVLRLAVDIEADFPLPWYKSDQFGLDEGDVGNQSGILANESVEQMDGDLLVPFHAQQSLESEV